MGYICVCCGVRFERYSHFHKHLRTKNNCIKVNIVDAFGTLGEIKKSLSLCGGVMEMGKRTTTINK